MRYLEAFRDGLRERGLVEGDTIVIEWRWAEGSRDRFATLAAELVQLPVKVLVVENTTTASMAKKATTTIPIVVAGGGALLETGLVASLARPGGNITGIYSMASQINAKKLELLKEALPAVTRVAVLRGQLTYRPHLPVMEKAAQSLGMTLHLFTVSDPTAFESAFAEMTSAKADALFVLVDPFFAPYRAQIAALAVQHRLPSSCGEPSAIKAGCLISYGSSMLELGQRLAYYVDKILHGTNPAVLPVGQLMKYELLINLKTAKALGLTSPRCSCSRQTR
jgi:putative tryptophan/tyrosine transport system substrate-binding protein